MPTWYQGLERLVERHSDRVIEALRPILHRIERNQEKLMTLVSVDDSVLASVDTTLQGVLTQVQALVSAGTIPDGTPEVQKIVDDVTALTNALATPSTPVTPTPVDPTPVDPTPVDPTPVDPNPVVDPTA